MSDESQADRWDGRERDALYLLVPGEDQDGMVLWSMEDLGREMDYFDPESVIYPLVRAGLVNKTSDGHVFATRAGVRAVAMIGKVI